MDNTQLINAIQQVLQAQPLTRLQHSDNEGVLNILRKVFIERQPQDIKGDTLMSYIHYVDTIIAKSLLTYQEHKYLSAGISYLKEETNEILKDKSNVSSYNN